MAFSIKQHDTWPNLVLPLKNDGLPLDLSTAASVKVILRAGALIVQGPGTITDAVGGVVTYVWGAGDTDVVGEYKGEVEITWDSGKVETVPNTGYFKVKIIADLA